MIFMLMTVDEAQGHIQARDALLERLIPQMGAGSTAALEQVYAQTKTAVYGYALSILRHSHNAEDVMQEAYLKLYHAAAGYQPQGKPMAWILTIVRNLALMKLREGRRDGPSLEEEWAALPGTDFTGQSVDRMLLRAALTTLSDEERQIVILHGLTGLKHREIATLLSLPLSTVLSKYNRALKKLKQLVKEEDR